MRYTLRSFAKSSPTLSPMCALVLLRKCCVATIAHCSILFAQDHKHTILLPAGAPGGSVRIGLPLDAALYDVISVAI